MYSNMNNPAGLQPVAYNGNRQHRHEAKIFPVCFLMAQVLQINILFLHSEVYIYIHLHLGMFTLGHKKKKKTLFTGPTDPDFPFWEVFFSLLKPRFGQS